MYCTFKCVTCAVALDVGVCNIGMYTPGAENLILRTFLIRAQSHITFRFCALVNKMKI